MPRVFTELRPYRLFRVPNLANPSLFIFSLANAASSLHHRRPPSRLRPLLLFIVDCASVHDVSVAGIAPPPNNTWKATKFHHRRALRRASIAPFRHSPPQPPVGDKRCHCSVPLLRRVSCTSFTISSHRCTANSPRGKFKTRYFFFFFVLYIFLWFR